MRLRFNLLIMLLLLSGCASGPSLDSATVDHSLTPADVAAEPEISRGRQVLWGGVIVRTTNLADSTQLEVLAYPLDTQERPQPESASLGRFVVDKAGYLEPEDYAEGRLVTVIGTVNGARIGPVGETLYYYPVIGAQQMNLWPIKRTGDRRDIHIGVGVGSGGGSGGVGIGF